MDKQENKKKKFPKILSILLLTAISLSAAAAIYYLYFYDSFSIQKNALTAFPQESLDFNPKDLMLNKNQKELSFDKVNIYSNTLQFFKSQTEMVDSANLNYTISGKVKEIRVDNRPQNPNYTSAVITLESQNGNSIAIGYSYGEVQEAKIVLVTNSGTKDVSINDIKPGDTVHITRVSNLLDSNPDAVLIRIVKE